VRSFHQMFARTWLLSEMPSRGCVRTLVRLSAIALVLLAGSSARAEEPAAPELPGRRGGPTRIDFDDRVIQGQSNTSGAVYLVERKETELRSMVRPRLSFRHLTIRTVYDR
jgi:hypothetical protein